MAVATQLVARSITCSLSSGIDFPLQLRTEALARISQVLRDRGLRISRQVIDPVWIDRGLRRWPSGSC